MYPIPFTNFIMTISTSASIFNTPREGGGEGGGEEEEEEEEEESHRSQTCISMPNNH
jgi:hypothetical protein